MSSIDRLGILLPQIRAHAAALQRKPSASEASREEVIGASAKQKNKAAWFDSVLAAVGAIASEDPQRRRRAFRIYLQAVLAREWVLDRPEDPGFQALVDRVLVAMESSAHVREAMSEAGDLLIQRAAR